MIADENQQNVAPAMETIKGKKKAKSIEEIYTKKSQLEHILLRPDTYIGSIEKHTQNMWVFDLESRKMTNKQIVFVPGFYKIFDEIIVNAADNKQRDPTMNRIEVVINQDEQSISVFNNGRGIPIQLHKEHNVYVPELIFGHLLTGSNFDDEEQKTTGGRNGYGAKLANIFSTKFIVETADSSTSQQYKQQFSNNMRTINPPVIKKYEGTDFTRITFFPDLSKFNMSEFDMDIIGLLSKRVYDLAASNLAGGPKLNVYLNKEKISIKSFEDYIQLFEDLEPAVSFERLNERWEIGVGPSDGSFQQVSFVNSISTSKGGSHVNYIADQITNKLMTVVKKKNKGDEIKPNQIKNHLAIYVNCLIVNPAFDSQTKEFLTTKPSSFGSTCTVSDKMLKAIEKSPIVDNILNWAKFKQTADLKKKSGSKKSKLLGITKLDDANFAGTSKSSQCTLILTEGDSAKALAISGLGVVGRDYYGVFPLKGKLLNVREASHAQIMKNEEIQNITKILGLTFGKVYEDTSSLRYGHLMIMTDQDHDGSHIKGLLINFLHYFWPSLLRIDGFLQQFITPIVKCMKGKTELSFFTIPEYQQWKENNDDGKGWKIKYYKGLGTSTAAEAKEYFSNLDIHERSFEWDERANDMIDMAFAKKRVDDRKLWLLSMEPGVHIDYSAARISYDNFVNHELILFSHADNERSIAHFMDGLKPSQRKVLFACFKRNLKQEIKVAQLAGYVSEHSAYHHGEASLTQTIIGMAQNFVGSNNINLLSPCGQFGTRLMGGKDAASPRYVFTKLEEITRLIFHPDDDALLEYLDEDGQSIEPTFYAPVIPMALVNGSEGIGTGWSSSIPNYNPRDIISNLKKMIEGEEPEEMTPWYRGFTGTIQNKEGKGNNTFTVFGNLDQIDDQTVQISELPVGKWTTDYKQYLESVLIGNTNNNPANKEDGAVNVTPFVKDFKENHTDTTVLFTVSCPVEKLEEISNEKGGLMKKFKLESSISATNMHLFDLNGQIRKYDGSASVLKEFFGVRMQLYHRRKQILLQKLDQEWQMLDNKMRFLSAVVSGEIVVANRKKVDLLSELARKGYKSFYPNKPTVDNENGSDDDQIEEKSSEKGYDYLLSMKLWNLTLEKVKELTEQRNKKLEDLEKLRARSVESIWLEDLEKLEEGLDLFEAAHDETKRLELAAQKKAKSKSKIVESKVSKSSAPKIEKQAVVSKVKLAPKVEQTIDLQPSQSQLQPQPAVSTTISKWLQSSKPAASKLEETKSIQKILTVDLIESDDEPSETIAPISRPKRAASKPLKIESDDDDFIVDSEEDEFDSEGDDDDDAFSEDETPIKKPPKAKVAPKKPVSTKTTTKETVKSKEPAKPKETAKPKEASKSKGIKRPQKDNSKAHSLPDIASPVALTPPVKKRAKKEPLAKKATKSLKSQFAEVTISPKARPARKRNATNYAKYYEESEEDDEEEEEELYDTDSFIVDDDSESDFE